MIVALEATGAVLGEINALIAEDQLKIDAFNLKVKDKKTHLENIKTRFWNCFRASCDQVITSARKVHSELGVKRKRSGSWLTRSA